MTNDTKKINTRAGIELGRDEKNNDVATDSRSLQNTQADGTILREEVKGGGVQDNEAKLNAAARPTYRFVDEKRKHIHELAEDGVNYKPLKGTTTVINEVYPPPLAWWGSAMALEKLGFISEKKEPNELLRKQKAQTGMDNLIAMFENETAIDDYRDFLDECYRNHDEYKKSKGKAGTDIHAEIEAYVKLCLKLSGGLPVEAPKEMNVHGFSQWATANVKQFLWSEAHCYSKELWVGGITDWGAIMKNGKLYIGDNKPSIYPKNFIQTAAYGIQIKENGLFDANGKEMKILSNAKWIDGYCIFNYNDGVAHYISGDWVAKLEDAFRHTIDIHNMLELKGSPILE